MLYRRTSATQQNAPQTRVWRTFRIRRTHGAYYTIIQRHRGLVNGGTRTKALACELVWRFTAGVCYVKGYIFI
jgi:hypothetical protein